MARIYIGRTTGIGSFERHVVLKMILPERANDEMSVQMFLDEARLSASLHHQNVAQVFEVGEDAGMHFLAMEYVHGQDLRALLARAGSVGTRVPLELALTLVAGAASGLHHAHERRSSDGVPMGIVHRDVSPSNIMVAYDGAIKLLDFGIAKATSRSIETQQGVIKGKFAYMSPEQCRGRDVDARSDVFSLGIILYEVTTQHRCFRADSDFDTMHRIVTGDVVRPTRLVQGYPPALEAIVMKALAVDAPQRYQSAGLLLEALESFAASARLSLSTMALGRFMRELFGEVPEPWLTSTRASTSGAAVQEQTISSTNETSGRPKVRLPSTPPPPPPPRSSPSIRPPSAPPVRHEDAPLHLPAEPDVAERDAQETKVSREDPSERRAKHAAPRSSQQRVAGAVEAPVAERVSSPSLAAGAPQPPSWPNGSQPIPPVAGTASPLSGTGAPITGSGPAARPIPGSTGSRPNPLFSGNTGSGSGRSFSAKTGSGSGPLHSAMRPSVPSISTGYANPTTRSDPARARYEDPQVSSLPAAATPVALPPAAPIASSSRPLYLGFGIALVAIIVLLVISILEGPDEPASTAGVPPASTAASTTTPVGRATVPAAALAPSAPSASAGAQPSAQGEAAATAPASGGSAATASASGGAGSATSSDAAPAAGSAASAGTAASAGSAAGSATPPAAVEDPSITLRITSTPTGADVLLAGTPIGTTPLELSVKRKASVAALTVHRAGYKDATAMVDLSADYKSEVKLIAQTPEPAPRAPANRDPRPAQRAPKRNAAPAPATKKCQPPERYNPYDTSCNGKPCPACPMGTAP